MREGDLYLWSLPSCKDRPIKLLCPSISATSSSSLFSNPQSNQLSSYKFKHIYVPYIPYRHTRNTIMYRGLILLNHLLLILSIFPIQSDATSIIHIFRQLAAKSRPLAKPQIPPFQISPSPSPSPAAPTPLYLPNKEPVVTKPNTEPVVRKPNTEPVVTGTCDRMSKKCHINRVTACFGVEGSLLLVLNDDISLKVNVTVLPVNITYKDIEIPRSQAKKINISDSVGGSSSIVLHAGNRHCIIPVGAVVPKDNINLQFPSFDNYITPINGAYVLIASVLIIGGTWTCFKSWEGRHTHVNGVPYQELEMGQSDLVSSVNVETAEGWDQSWDDDWDQEKGVKSASGDPVKSSTGNGNVSRSNSDGWQNDWDD